jgi:hypothetical protein
MINYANPGWANLVPPPINSTNLNAISNALATLSTATDNGASGTATQIYNDKNVGSNWGTALIAALGSGWSTTLGAALGAGWGTALGTALSSVTLAVDKITAASGNAVLGGSTLTWTHAGISSGDYTIPAGTYAWLLSTDTTIGSGVDFVYNSVTMGRASCVVSGRNGYASGFVYSNGSNAKFSNITGSNGWSLMQITL